MSSVAYVNGICVDNQTNLSDYPHISPLDYFREGLHVDSEFYKYVKSKVVFPMRRIFFNLAEKGN